MSYEEQLAQVRANVINNIYPIIQQQGSSNQMITLHWTAGHYDQLFDDYHMCIDGNGTVHIMNDLDAYGAHCYHENSNNFGIATCSNVNASLNGDGYMGYSTYEPGPEPVNGLQLEAMATLVYLCCVQWNIPLVKYLLMASVVYVVKIYTITHLNAGISIFLFQNVMYVVKMVSRQAVVIGFAIELVRLHK